MYLLDHVDICSHIHQHRVDSKSDDVHYVYRIPHVTKVNCTPPFDKPLRDPDLPRSQWRIIARVRVPSSQIPFPRPAEEDELINLYMYLEVSTMDAEVWQMTSLPPVINGDALRRIKKAAS